MSKFEEAKEELERSLKEKKTYEDKYREFSEYNLLFYCELSSRKSIYMNKVDIWLSSPGSGEQDYYLNKEEAIKLKDFLKDVFE